MIHILKSSAFAEAGRPRSPRGAPADSRLMVGVQTNWGQLTHEMDWISMSRDDAISRVRRQAAKDAKLLRINRRSHRPAQIRPRGALPPIGALYTMNAALTLPVQNQGPSNKA
jgi:hypothetical protein